MSFITCSDLSSTLTQSITLTLNKRYHIPAIGIRILMYNSPAGTFTLSLKSGVTTIASKSFTSAELKTDLSTANNYLHMMKILEFDEVARLNGGVYTLELSSSGYTNSASSFIAWVKSFENVFNEREDEFTSNESNPFDYLIYEYAKQDINR